MTDFIFWGSKITAEDMKLRDACSLEETTLDHILKSIWKSKDITLTTKRSNQSILKEINPVTGRTDTEAEDPILCPPDVKSQLIGKDPDAGKDKAEGEGGTKEWVA